MKLLLLLYLSLLTANSYSQRYAIIDRKLKIPLRLADTVTKAKGFFVVEKKNIDSLVAKLEMLEARLRKVERENIDEVEYNIGTTLITIKAVKKSFADRLNVALSTDTGEGHIHKFYIVDAALTNNDNARYLNKLIKYIKK